jgi:hypothetical protein
VGAGSVLFAIQLAPIHNVLHIISGSYFLSHAPQQTTQPT